MLALASIKQVQSRRFAGTYADLLAGDRYCEAARFFLDELYSEVDYSERDAQFARIASAIQKLLPQHAVATAVSLAELHISTEQLDYAMAHSWCAQRREDSRLSSAGQYILAWRKVGHRSERDAQLSAVLAIGRDLDRLTRTRGLRLMLKMMRGPASAAGFSALQHFLETGFDTFSRIARQPGGVQGFLGMIESRESSFISMMFDLPPEDCEEELLKILSTGR